MKSIGIKLADGSFYPILEEGSVEKKDLEVTTVKDNQTKVQIDLYRSETNSMDDAEYVDSLEITHLKPHPNGEPTFSLELNLDSDNHLHAQMKDPETGKSSAFKVDLVSRTEAERQEPANFALNDSDSGILPGVSAVSSILDNANDEAFSFDPISDLDSPSSNGFDDDDDTTIDLTSLDIDSIEEAPVSDDFMTDAQVIDDDMVSDKPLTDEDMLSPDDLFVDDADNKKRDVFVDNDGTGFSFVDDSSAKAAQETVAEEKAAPAVEEKVEPAADENEFQIPSSLLDSSLFDEIPTGNTVPEEKYDEPVDTDIAPPDFSDLELDDMGDFDDTLGETIFADTPQESATENADDTTLALDENLPDENLAAQDLPADDFANESFDENLNEAPQDTSEENPYDLPDFEALVSDTDQKTEPEAPAETEIPETKSEEETTESEADFSLPTFDELDTSSLDDFDSTSTLGDFTIPDESENDAIEPQTEEVSKDLDLPNFDENDTAATEETVDSAATEESDEIAIPDFSVDEQTDSTDLDLPDFGDDDSAIVDTADTESAKTETTEDSATTEIDTAPETDSASDFSVDSLDLPDFGDVDLTSTEEPAPEEKPADDFSLDLPDFGEDGTADTDSFAPTESFAATENSDSEPAAETETKEDTSFDIDDMDMPDFDNLDATSEPESTKSIESTEASESIESEESSIPSDFPDFGDPFDSVSSATADTDFDFPDFDDSPTKMEDSETKAIFGDFDDTDAVFEGETDGFVDPNAGKKKKIKKAKKVSKTMEYGEEEEKDNSKKPIIFLIAALAACLVVIFVLVFQSRGAKSGKKNGPEIASANTNAEENVSTKKSTEIVSSMGEPRSSEKVVEQDEILIEQKELPGTVTGNTEKPDAETIKKEIAAEDVASEKTVSETKTTETKTAETKPVEEEEVVKRPKVFETATKVEPQAQVVIPAKEDTIIVASNPETVVPVKKNPTPASTEDIKYTVVWGDTLWDISTAYYKTPYRYNRIAEHNGISDANKIRSGQVLLIPAE